MKFDVEFSEEDALILLNAMLSYSEALAGSFKPEEVEGWMVNSVKLAQRLYHTFTEAYPSLKQKSAITAWWDDFNPDTGRPYKDEYQRFIASYNGRATEERLPRLGVSDGGETKSEKPMPLLETEGTIDVLHAKGSYIVAIMGEVIAKNFLWQRTRRWPQRPMPISPTFDGDESDYELKQFMLAQQERVSKWQEEFIRDFDGLTQYQIDYLVTREGQYHLIGMGWGGIYLATVKTIRGNRKPHWSRDELPAREEVMRAKSVGFKVLLIVVRLGDNWKFQVTCKEL